ncbi:MAG: DNA translocase FtsK [Butyrivibrio sp.]|nr:DNA translocase FtsK [Acetatifactor muris]MCM1559280.1 DNA translocase FtsK [Butyrivibrio sp.]
MAASNGKKTSSSQNRKNSGSVKSGGQNRKTGNKAEDMQTSAGDGALFHEIGLIALFVLMVILFCCNFGIIGPVGDAVSGFLFGVFGFTAYAAPVLLFLAAAFRFANEGNPNAVRKMAAGFVLFLMLGAVCDLIVGGTAGMADYSVKTIYESCRDAKNGGGVLGGSISFLLQHYLGTIGTVLVVLLCAVISLILVTERSLLKSVKEGGSRMRELSREDAERRRELAEQRREEAGRRKEDAERRRENARQKRQEQEEQRRLKAEAKENEKILRMEKKVSGVMLDTTLLKPEEQTHRDDIHEIMFSEEYEEAPEGFAEERTPSSSAGFDFEKVHIRSMHQVSLNDMEPEEAEEPEGNTADDLWEEPEPMPAAYESDLQAIRIHKEGNEGEAGRIHAASGFGRQGAGERSGATERPSASPPPVKDMQRAPKKYMFPPLSRLQKGVAATGDSTRELKETAMHLQQTLNTFGVRVTVTDISQGPSVTRYELQPEQGVKVSKIVGLADDIKLNLAATDIRIEAPIPGKAAVGIEVPNKENMTVALRDLLETKEFKEFPSNIAFAVGKDIAGQTVVADIAKMPHMLIAGATGSGKSVCINTLIMSILYKAHPDDVKLIMVDPKVVELSVYNGIPHLLIPVVTDPKKASAALHWGVSEMEDRYRKFADFNVRDLKGYNKKVESMREGGDEEAPAKMPQIVIIVDELADLMMVSPGEVEESICRLAQLARAAGIHLIIATQRPSVDVITGLIKANMPSRVAFAVSSGVDSRTILDMNGAEKLLGKGDMLFYPQGYSKPARIQGAFVSDREVSDVVDFLKNQALGNVYAEEVEEKILNIGSGVGGSGGGDADLDEFFEKAGRFIIEQDKASIGALQRLLKIGFNRAARIMDQLCEYGVVDKGEGTKPRKVLMGPEQFEQLVEEIV